MPARSASPMSAEGLIAALREAAQAPAVVRAGRIARSRVEALRGAAIQRLAALALRAQGLRSARSRRGSRSDPVVGRAAAVGRSRGGVTSDRCRRSVTRSLAPGEPAAGRRGQPRRDAAATAAAVPVGRRCPARLPAAVVPRPAGRRGQPVRWGGGGRAGRPRRGGGDRPRGRRPGRARDRSVRRRDLGVGAVPRALPARPRAPARRRDDHRTARLGRVDRSLRGRHRADVQPPRAGDVAARPVSGSIDRVDRAEDGRIHVVDFKTGRTAASAAATAEHPQLGIYQLAIRLGALDGRRTSPSSAVAAVRRLGPGGARPPRRPVRLGHAEGAHPGPARRRLDLGQRPDRRRRPARRRPGVPGATERALQVLRLPLHVPGADPGAGGAARGRRVRRIAASHPRCRTSRRGAGHADPTADRPRPAGPGPPTSPARASPRRRSSSRSGGMTSDDHRPHPPAPDPRPPRPTPTPMPRAELDALLGLTLTDEQWECVSAPLEPFVIVAGAGTGKTAVMAARVLWLVASGFVAEHEVLGLTFTNKAAAELAQRVTAQLNHWRAQRPADRGEAVGEPTIATYHSFARRLIDEQGLRVGIEPGARLLSGPAVAQLAYRVVCQSRGLVVTRHGPSRVAGDVVRLDANLAEQTITTDELRAHDRAVIAAIDALPKADEGREGHPRHGRAAARARRPGRRAAPAPSRPPVGWTSPTTCGCAPSWCAAPTSSSQAMRAAYRVVLLDEYQDTSIAQRVILSTLFAGGGVTAVGDPMQAIYGWRSASVANIDAFAQHFGRDGVGARARPVGQPALGHAHPRGRQPHRRRAARPAPPGGRAAAAGAAGRRGARGAAADGRRRAGVDRRPGARAGRVGHAARAHRDPRPRQRPARAAAAAARRARGPGEHLGDGRPDHQPVRDRRAVHAAGPGRPGGQHLAGGPARRPALADRPPRPRAARRPGAAARGRSADPHRLGRRAGAAARAAARGQRVQGPRRAPEPAGGRREPGSGGVGARPPRGSPSSWASCACCSRRSAPRWPTSSAPWSPSPGPGSRPTSPPAARASATSGWRACCSLVEGFSDADGRTGLGAFLAYLDAAEQLGSGEDVDLPDHARVGPADDDAQGQGPGVPGGRAAARVPRLVPRRQGLRALDRPSPTSSRASCATTGTSCRSSTGTPPRRSPRSSSRAVATTGPATTAWPTSGSPGPSRS